MVLSLIVCCLCFFFLFFFFSILLNAAYLIEFELWFQIRWAPVRTVFLDCTCFPRLSK